MRTKFIGYFITKKRRWGLTPFSWINILLLFSALGYLFLNKSHQFLAEHAPVEAKILIIEGPLPEYAITEVLHEYYSQNYDLIVLTGGPLSSYFKLSGYQSHPELISSILLEQIPEDQLVVLSRPAVLTDRTFANAQRLVSWLDTTHQEYPPVNIISVGVHARRSRLLFKKALGHTQVGVVNIQDKSYDPKIWWKSSNGFRVVISECIAYIYARFLFYP